MGLLNVRFVVVLLTGLLLVASPATSTSNDKLSGSLFGALSGVVTFHLMKLAPRLRGAGEPHETDSHPDAQGPASGAGTTDVRDAPP